MKKFEDIDKNFKIKQDYLKDGFTYYNVLEKPFKVYGLMHDGEKFVRLFEDVAKTVSEGVLALYMKTAGGRVRFRTNSEVIRISAKLNNVLQNSSHFTLCGCAGFDLYDDDKVQYKGTFSPPGNMVDDYESEINVEHRTLRTYTINFPPYSGVTELYIGVENGSILCEAPQYKYEIPIVYYGSSITQGGCASRPGNTYQQIISRHFDANYINLGFAGWARAEKEISDYISNMDMSIFVYDYDHNAPTIEHLIETHERMFKEIRNNHPDLPVIILSRPNPYPCEDEQNRKQVIIKTYENAIAGGDKNVYFIDGEHIFEMFGGDSCTVDRTHPNDLGFMCMAKTLIPVMEHIFNNLK